MTNTLIKKGVRAILGKRSGALRGFPLRTAFSPVSIIPSVGVPHPRFYR